MSQLVPGRPNSIRDNDLGAIAWPEGSIEGFVAGFCTTSGCERAVNDSLAGSNNILTMFLSSFCIT